MAMSYMGLRLDSKLSALVIHIGLTSFISFYEQFFIYAVVVAREKKGTSQFKVKPKAQLF